MTLQQLHYFLAAIEHGTFSKAAENLHISQPSLSEQILRLEEHLGTQQKAAKRGRIYFLTALIPRKNASVLTAAVGRSDSRNHA
jgi:hypothetical protein